MTETTATRVIVKAPARLHMGFMDMHGGLGRSFGSLGLCLDNLSTQITVTNADEITASGPSEERALAYASKFISQMNISGGAHIQVHSAIPEHMGLGSGTQLSLAVGMAITQLKGVITPIEEIAIQFGRGARSGIGIGAFKYGGFLVDGGRGQGSGVPPIISHLKFPEAWRLVLVFDHARCGVHGKAELDAFKTLQAMQDRTVGELCRILLMQVLPALAEENCVEFGDGISKIQQQVGDHFAEVQGGRYCSKKVAAALDSISAHGATGLGQSSWGPTGFAIFANETQAYQAVKDAKEIWQEEKQLDFMVCRARNQMADVLIQEASMTDKINVQNL